MAPPPQPIHKQEHQSRLLHKKTTFDSTQDEPPPVACANIKCTAYLIPAAKFCMECGEPRPKIKSTKPKKPSPLEEDCIHDSGCRRAVWLFVHTVEKDSPWFLRHAERYEKFSIMCVLYLVFSDIIVSIPEVGQDAGHSVYYLGIEAFIYGMFTVEYLLRLWSCMESRNLCELGAIRGRLVLMRGVMELVDLTVLVAYYINFIPGMDRLKGLQALRMIRLLRIAALLKVERKTSSFSKIVNVLRTKKNELVATLFTAVVLMLMSATTMYYLETEVQPEAFGSVPAAMWWSVASLTTVGYGDVVPMTPAGKVLGSVVAFFGVGLFALPAGILGSGFVEEVDKAKRLAAKENDEDDVEDEILGDQEEENLMIHKITEDVKGLRGTVEDMQSGQCAIAHLLNSMCPSLEIPLPAFRKSADAFGRQVTDAELSVLQDSVSAKLEGLKRMKTLQSKKTVTISSDIPS